MRVLKWMLDRIENKGHGEEHVFGVTPNYEDINWDGLDFTREQFATATAIDRQPGPPNWACTRSCSSSWPTTCRPSCRRP